MPDPTIPELAAWCRRAAEVKRASERQMKGIVDNVAAKHAAEAARYDAIAAALERAERLEAALERSVAIADEHLRRVPGHHPDEKHPRDLVAQGYGNAALNIACELRRNRAAALTPPAERHQATHILAHLRRIPALEAENARLREALVSATAHLVGAASAYRKFACRHRSVGRAQADPFFTTRAADFERAAEKAQAALTPTPGGDDAEAD